ncbi:MAG: hypothetical protein IJ275_06680 [Ruminococcus sp.]|nr:hypothetical protein [Ruminococcus sp.]
MASTSYTNHLGLCAWEGADRPKRMDFVNDNAIIDEKLGEHLINSNIHVTAEEKIQFLNPYTVFSYAGDGAKTKTFTLDGSYTFAIIFQKFYPPVELDTNGNVISHFSIVGRVFGSSSSVTLTSNSIVVTQDSEPTDGVINNFNEEQGQYVVVLFK